MTKMQKKKVFCKQNIPNMLLVLRMVLAVLVVAFLIANHYVPHATKWNPLIYQLSGPKWMPGNYKSNIYMYLLIAGVLFVLAAITDWLDGFLARKYNWVSDFGKFWDPVADKVLINSTLICFAWHGLCLIAIPIIMIARDVAVDAQRMVAAKKNIVVAANWWGKVKTILQMVGIIFIFFIFAGTYGDSTNVMWWTIQNLLLYCATIISVVSGVIYFRDIRRSMKEVKHA